MQEVDAERRLAILRGEEPPPLPDPDGAEADRQVFRRSRDDFAGSGRRQRKRQGEDDTDFELRLARERQGGGSLEKVATSLAPIVDHAGHIDLFGDEKQRQHSEKNDEVERQKKKKERDLEDQYTMRFSNAAGRNAPGKPWYSTSSSEVATVTAQPPSKDVWGNDDPKRQERQTKRAAASDPLAMMRSGAAKVRELKKERKRVREEREAELKDLKKEERRRERHSRRDSSRSRSRDRDRRKRHRSTSRERDERHNRRHDSRSDDRERRERRHRDRDGEKRPRRPRSRSRSQSPRRP